MTTHGERPNDTPGERPRQTAGRSPRPGPTTLHGERRRSVAFLEREDRSWACFLVTFRGLDDGWHGYFSFRPGDSELPEDEVRTTDIFVESSEDAIHHKARSLGRPLLRGLLDSAIHTSEKQNGRRAHLRGRFRSLLTRNSVEIAGKWTDDRSAMPDDDEIERLRSLYESYRIDQVSHFICLVDPDAFESAVDRILEGEKIDFRTKDRVQFARMVVDHIERLLPLPDFEMWVQDFLDDPEAYRRYTHTLHREGRLP